MITHFARRCRALMSGTLPEVPLTDRATITHVRKWLRRIDQRIMVLSDEK